MEPVQRPTSVHNIDNQSSLMSSSEIKDPRHNAKQWCFTTPSVSETSQREHLTALIDHPDVRHAAFGVCAGDTGASFLQGLLIKFDDKRLRCPDVHDLAGPCIPFVCPNAKPVIPEICLSPEFQEFGDDSTTARFRGLVASAKEMMDQGASFEDLFSSKQHIEVCSQNPSSVMKCIERT